MSETVRQAAIMHLEYALIELEAARDCFTAPDDESEGSVEYRDLDCIMQKVANEKKWLEGRYL